MLTLIQTNRAKGRIGHARLSREQRSCSCIQRATSRGQKSAQKSQMALGHSLAVETPGHNERGVQSYEDEQHGKLFLSLYWRKMCISTFSF